LIPASAGVTSPRGGPITRRLMAQLLGAGGRAPIAQFALSQSAAGLRRDRTAGPIVRILRIVRRGVATPPLPSAGGQPAGVDVILRVRAAAPGKAQSSGTVRSMPGQEWGRSERPAAGHSSGRPGQFRAAAVAGPRRRRVGQAGARGAAPSGPGRRPRPSARGRGTPRGVTAGQAARLGRDRHLVDGRAAPLRGDPVRLAPGLGGGMRVSVARRGTSRRSSGPPVRESRQPSRGSSACSPEQAAPVRARSVSSRAVAKSVSATVAGPGPHDAGHAAGARGQQAVVVADQGDGAAGAGRPGPCRPPGRPHQAGGLLPPLYRPTRPGGQLRNGWPL
jgi:hypothetical protein